MTGVIEPLWRRHFRTLRILPDTEVVRVIVEDAGEVCLSPILLVYLFVSFPSLCLPPSLSLFLQIFIPLLSACLSFCPFVCLSVFLPVFIASLRLYMSLSGKLR